MDLLKTVHKATAGLRNRVMLMLGRAVLSAINDNGGVQVVQATLLEDELRGDLERFQEYGFTSVPLPGAEALVAFIGGNRDHGVVVAVEDRRYRLHGLKGGEVAIYTDEGDFIHLQRNRKIEVKTLELTINAENSAAVNTKKFAVNASESITMRTAQTGIHTDGLNFSSQNGGEVEAQFNGGIKASNDVKANGGAVSLRKHVHEGVQPGGGTTAKPVGG